ncbi:MAG: CehA/McbA family metallohydrolase [Deltaproteobacteria bacterium]|nr:CehA/McbA family metallohydrolase [Deltaproteobacteria bacterium]MBW2339221.1 CehA/McbA family metallohydrolase [Deltaproteobacteria bacterium]
MAIGFPFEYVGNLHIHSTRSDGGGSAKQIAEAARTVGLDFIALNDHSYLTQLHLEDEGYHKGIPVLVGSEIGRMSHHYLAYNIRDQVDDESYSPQEVIDAVNRQGGFGFLAHPFEEGMPFLENTTTYTWNDWSVKGYTGICIWNFTSRWKENVKSFWHGIYHLIFKTYTVKGPSQKTLETWDSLCLKRQVVALGGSDAHGSFLKVGPIKFTPLSYRYLLGTINTHILTSSPLKGDFTTDKGIIYASLRAGTCFVAHDGLSPAKGFRFYFTRNKDESRVEMGQEDAFSPGTLVSELPEGGMIRIIKDGSLFKKGYGGGLSIKITENGVYRVEVFRKMPLFGWRPWIFSNPIYLR